METVRPAGEEQLAERLKALGRDPLIEESPGALLLPLDVSFSGQTQIRNTDD